MELTPNEIEEINAEISRAPNKQSVCIEALKIAQRYRGWISDDVLEAVADVLNMTTDELDGMATFYNNIYRKPVGRHIIRVCNTASCWILGSESILDFLKKRLGIEPCETTSDGRFTLLPHVCIGFCHHAPAMMIDDDIYGDLDTERIEEIFNIYP
jgi:NADH-quinone oxidoreductase subunit E